MIDLSLAERKPRNIFTDRWVIYTKSGGVILQKHHSTIPGITVIMVIIIFSILTVISVQATTFIIKFGGTLGFNYSPSQLAVAVGDTVKWEGSFSSHPLSSTSVPQGAASFHVASGTAFSYPVLIAGTYDYRCDLHFSSGMIGSFTATVTDVPETGTTQHLQPNSFKLDQNYPNPFNARTMIQFYLPVAQQVKLKIYALTGAEIATLLDGFMPAGEFTIPFDGSNLASGVYFYQLVTEKDMDTKRLVLAK
jgi:plastocyanin